MINLTLITTQFEKERFLIVQWFSLYHKVSFIRYGYFRQLQSLYSVHNVQSFNCTTPHLSHPNMHQMHNPIISQKLN